MLRIKKLLGIGYDDYAVFIISTSKDLMKKFYRNAIPVHHNIEKMQLRNIPLHNKAKWYNPEWESLKKKEVLYATYIDMDMNYSCELLKKDNIHITSFLEKADVAVINDIIDCTTSVNTTVINVPDKKVLVLYFNGQKYNLKEQQNLKNHKINKQEHLLRGYCNDAIAVPGFFDDAYVMFTDSLMVFNENDIVLKTYLSGNFEGKPIITMASLFRLSEKPEYEPNVEQLHRLKEMLNSSDDETVMLGLKTVLSANCLKYRETIKYVIGSSSVSYKLSNYLGDNSVWNVINYIESLRPGLGYAFTTDTTIGREDFDLLAKYIGLKCDHNTVNTSDILVIANSYRRNGNYEPNFIVDGKCEGAVNFTDENEP